jgi:hypothetical protein
MKTLGKDELKEILIKNWMTHDADYSCIAVKLGQKPPHRSTLASYV